MVNPKVETYCDIGSGETDFFMGFKSSGFYRGYLSSHTVYTAKNTGVSPDELSSGAKPGANPDRVNMPYETLNIYRHEEATFKLYLAYCNSHNVFISAPTEK